MRELAARMVQHDGRTLSRVGWTSRPFTANSAHFTENTPPDVGAPFCVTPGRIGCVVSHPIIGSLNDDRFLVLHQPVDQGRWQCVVHFEQVVPFPGGSIDS